MVEKIWIRIHFYFYHLTNLVFKNFIQSLLIYSIYCDINCCEFFSSPLAMVFHWSLSNSKSLQILGTLLNILTDLSIAVVWMISARPPILSPSSSLTKTLEIVPNTPISIGITVTFMFHSSFSSRARSKYMSLFSFSWVFTLWSTGRQNSLLFLSLLF